MTPVDNGKDIDACQLREIEDPVRRLEQFPDILIVCLGCPHSELWKLGQSVYSAKDSLNHALGIVRRRAANVDRDAGKVFSGQHGPMNRPTHDARRTSSLRRART